MLSDSSNQLVIILNQGLVSDMRRVAFIDRVRRLCRLGGGLVILLTQKMGWMVSCKSFRSCREGWRGCASQMRSA